MTCWTTQRSALHLAHFHLFIVFCADKCVVCVSQAAREEMDKIKKGLHMRLSEDVSWSTLAPEIAPLDVCVFLFALSWLMFYI